MAKWAEPSNDTVKIVKETLETMGLENYIDTKILVNNDQNKVVTTKKESPSNKFAYGYDLQVIVNEIIFEGLPEKQQLLALQEVLAGVEFNPENERLTIKAPQKVYRSFIDKYGWNEYEVLLESIETLYQAQKEKKKEEEVNNT